MVCVVVVVVVVVVKWCCGLCDVVVSGRSGGRYCRCDGGGSGGGRLMLQM